MICAVVFDMDGLMFETERVSLRLLREVCAERGLQFTLEMKRQMCGANFAVSEKIFADAFGAQDPAFTFERCWGQVRQRMEQEFTEHGVPCRPGLRELLRFLSEQGLRAAVASGSARSVVQHYIEMAGLDTCFTAIIGGGDFQEPKPSPECFLLAAERMQVPPENCLVLEDSGRGLEAAQRAHMHAIWVPDLDIPSPEVLERVDATCDTLHEVIGWLKAQNHPGDSRAV